MNIPVANHLKKRSQVETAALQDEIVIMLYSVCPDSVMHGGTSIWRCYSGKRFSEYLDFYSSTFQDCREDFEKIARSRGLEITKMKDTGNVIFSNITNGRTDVKLEVSRIRNPAGTQTLYELIDGSKMEILSLSPEEIILEKISAYSNRKYIRDLYDIYHLTGGIVEITAVRNKLSDFLQKIEKPVDESVLKSIVYIGLPPSFDRMVTEIRRRIS